MIRFLISSNIYVALAAASLYIYYAIVLGRDFFLTTPLLVFSATFIAYNFLRVISIYRVSIPQSPLSLWYKSYKSVLIIPHIVAVFLFILGMLDLNLIQICIIIITGAMVLFYERLFGNGWSLRVLPYMKPLVISLCWTLLTVGMHYELLNWQFTLSLIDCFLFISLLCLLFDLKDAEMDKLESIKSITHLKDQKLPFIFAIIHALVYIVFLNWSYHFSYQYLFGLGLLLLLLASLKTMKNPILFAFITDGAILYKALLGIYLL